MLDSRLLSALTISLGLFVAACGAPVDGASEPGAPAAAAQGRTSNGLKFNEAGDVVAAGEQPDPTAGEEGDEGSGALPADSGTPPGADTGAPSGGGDAGTDSGPSSGDSGPSSGGCDTGSVGGGAHAGTGSGGADTGGGTTTIDSGATPGAPASALVLTEASRELTVMKSSTYDHTTSIDESKGIFNFDCSGFVGYDLANVLPDAIATVRTETSVARPLAKDFEAFFASIPAGKSKGRWHRVLRAADLVPGDVVAWLKPADVISSNTGHVMIVHATPTKNPRRADEYIVPVIDSTASPHGVADSRAPSGTGLGSGTIGLLVDAAGAPYGYRWTGGISANDEITTISLGHVE